MNAQTTAKQAFNADTLSTDTLNADTLNALQKQFAPQMEYRFVQQSHLKDARYYEQIIFEDKRIPTRTGSLHDYFNGLIWLRFAHTKSLLNALHCQDIAKYGHKTRSVRRDRITHFDECGIVLVSDLPELQTRLAMHDWEWLFVQHRDKWFASKKGIIALHFGHANLEMLCNPFIGLTAKALVINDSSLLSLAYTSMHNTLPIDTRLDIQHQIDLKLCSYLHEQACFENKVWLPLPLLGIPAWHSQPQDSHFYADKSYFMPHPNQR